VRSFLRLLPEHQVDPAVRVPSSDRRCRGVHRAARRRIRSSLCPWPLERMYPATESARDWPSVMFVVAVAARVRVADQLERATLQRPAREARDHLLQTFESSGRIFDESNAKYASGSLMPHAFTIFVRNADRARWWVSQAPCRAAVRGRWLGRGVSGLGRLRRWGVAATREDGGGREATAMAATDGAWDGDTPPPKAPETAHAPTEPPPPNRLPDKAPELTHRERGPHFGRDREGVRHQRAGRVFRVRFVEYPARGFEVLQQVVTCFTSGPLKGRTLKLVGTRTRAATATTT